MLGSFCFEVFPYLMIPTAVVFFGCNVWLDSNIFFSFLLLTDKVTCACVLPTVNVCNFYTGRFFIYEKVMEAIISMGKTWSKESFQCRGGGDNDKDREPESSL